MLQQMFKKQPGLHRIHWNPTFSTQQALFSHQHRFFHRHQHKDKHGSSQKGVDN
jgi:hypothetical protein